MDERPEEVKPPALHLYTYEQKLAAIKRELAYRRRVYERRVASGKMTPELARNQIAIFESIQFDYEQAVRGEDLFKREDD